MKTRLLLNLSCGFLLLLTLLGVFFRKKEKEITTCRDYILYILLLYMNCIYIHKGDTFITCVCARAVLFANAVNNNTLQR